MSTDPTLQFEQGSPRLGQPEISPPAADVAVPIIPQLRTRAAAATIPFLANLCLESLHTLRRDTDPLLSVQSEAQELALPHPPGSALGGIHLPSQMLLDPILYRGQRAFRCGLTAYVDIAVVRIAAIAMLPPIQFLIQLIQIDVGQQRSQRAALWRPLLARHHYPLHHRPPPQVLPIKCNTRLSRITSAIRPITMS